ncbi:hypothetical protein PanWU01x14_118410 [Parasponia andersonii]|uniref:Uncharacterized protein n=1 Tax=Parasponia andersonii TaxID=3476 RepID=A0A2P5CVS7_PARAD|nr:hypothetical protein PanWU01x14_118410 [Parasponia andersonii]
MKSTMTRIDGTSMIINRTQLPRSVHPNPSFSRHVSFYTQRRRSGSVLSPLMHLRSSS